MLPHSVKYLVRDRRGGTAIMVGVMLFILLGFVSLGAEVVDALMTQRRMQAAADSAAISAANAAFLGSPSPYQNEAFAIAAADGFTAGQGGTCTAVPTIYVGAPCAGDPAATATACSTGNGCVEVLIQQPFNLTLANVVTAGDFTLRARAVAKIPSDTGGSCTLALQRTGSGTITASGNGTVTYGGCSIAANSSDPNAINTNGSNSLIVGTGVYTGGTENWGSMNVQAGSPPAQCSTSNTSCVSGAPPQLNPYADVVQSTCGSYQTVPGGGGTIGAVGATVNCYNGFTINGNKTVNLTPGTYLINGSITMTSSNAGLTCSACVTGVSGVTIFLTGSGATVTITGGAMSLMAQPSGTYKGLLFYSTATCSGGNCAKFTGGSSMITQGAIVMPNQDVKFSGNTATSSANICTVIVGNTLTFTGISNVGSTNCSTFNTKTVAIPGSLIE